MAIIRWRSILAPATAMLCIAAIPSHYQKNLDIGPETLDPDCSISLPCAPTPVVSTQINAAVPYSPCRTPRRVAPEYNPKNPVPLIRVEPIYSEAMKKGISGLSMIELYVNELGEVSSARVMRCPPELVEKSLAAIRLWRYSPKFQDGEPIYQIAIASLFFERPPRFDSRVGVIVDRKGNLHDFDGNPVSQTKLQSSNSIIVTCAPSISFSVLENSLNALESEGIRNFLLSSWDYAFKSGRLFYRFLCGAGKTSDSDKLLHPPQLEIDVDHLAALAKASGSPAFLPSSTPVTYLSYVIYVSQRGEIVDVERTAGPVVTDVEEELRHSHVLQPGQLGTTPVPATISVFIAIK